MQICTALPYDKMKRGTQRKFTLVQGRNKFMEIQYTNEALPCDKMWINEKNYMVDLHYLSTYLATSKVVCPGLNSMSITSVKLSNCLTVTSLINSGSIVQIIGVTPSYFVNECPNSRCFAKYHSWYTILLKSLGGLPKHKNGGTIGNPVASRQPLNRRKWKNKKTKMTKKMAKTQLSKSITKDLAQTSRDLYYFSFLLLGTGF